MGQETTDCKSTVQDWNDFVWEHAGWGLADESTTNERYLGMPLKLDQQYRYDDCGHNITIILCSTCERSLNTAAVASKLFIAFITSFEESLADDREELEHSIHATLKINP